MRAALALALLAPGAAIAQGFAGLGTDAAGFARVTPGEALAFPRDHGAHPDFRIEWWYVTANLTGPDGAAYGAQWTLFRQATAPGPGEGWATPQIWMGHAALTSAATHRAAERFARGGVGQAGVRLGGFEAWIDDWDLRATAPPDAPAEQDALDALDALAMRARGPDFGYDLALRAEGPLVLHGEDGYSLKSARGQASYYYSQPFLRAEGTITLDGAEIPVTGTAWLDREWSSQPLDPDQKGWDWFSLSLDTGEKVMLYRFRAEAGDSFAGTWIGADGASAALRGGDVAMTPTGFAEIAGRRAPVRWRLAVAGRGRDVETAPLNPGSWNALRVPYWEGPVSVSGSHAGTGYLEMTGY
jgi:predicted secreted hydrolase